MELEDGLLHDHDKKNLEINWIYGWFMVTFASIGGFLFGYDTSVIAGANLYLKDTFPEVTSFQIELIVSMTLLGAAFGSLTGGSVSDKFGRKPTIFIADILFTVGCLIMAFTPSIAILILGRFIVGLGVGIAAMVVPVYLAELSPKRIRGIVVNLNTAFITAAQFLSLVICLLLGNQWRWMLGLAAVPSVFQGIGILFLPESPRWLWKINENEKAEKALKQIYVSSSERIQIVFNELKQEAKNVAQYENHSYGELISQLFTKYLPCLIVGCGLQMFQQLCGINTAMYYGPEIMKTAGFGDDSEHRNQALISALPLAGINSIGSIIA